MTVDLATVQVALVTGFMCLLFALGYLAGGQS